MPLPLQKRLASERECGRNERERTEEHRKKNIYLKWIFRERERIEKERESGSLVIININFRKKKQPIIAT